MASPESLDLPELEDGQPMLARAAAKKGGKRRRAAGALSPRAAEAAADDSRQRAPKGECQVNELGRKGLGREGRRLTADPTHPARHPPTLTGTTCFQCNQAKTKCCGQVRARCGDLNECFLSCVPLRFA